MSVEIKKRGRPAVKKAAPSSSPVEEQEEKKVVRTQEQEYRDLVLGASQSRMDSILLGLSHDDTSTKR